MKISRHLSINLISVLHVCIVCTIDINTPDASLNTMCRTVSPIVLLVLTKNQPMKYDLMHMVLHHCLPYQKWPITEAGDEIFDELFVVKR